MIIDQVQSYMYSLGPMGAWCVGLGGLFLMVAADWWAGE